MHVSTVDKDTQTGHDSRSVKGLHFCYERAKDFPLPEGMRGEERREEGSLSLPDEEGRRKCYYPVLIFASKRISLHIPFSSCFNSLFNMAGEEFDAVVVGAGFAGIYTLHKLRDDLGLRCLCVDAAGDVGGTW